MKLQMAFLLVGLRRYGARPVDLPMDIALTHGRYRVSEPPVLEVEIEGMPESESLLVRGECSVDPDGVRVVDDIFQEELSDGTRRSAKALTCPEVDDLTEDAQCIGGAISFGIGVPLEMSPLSDFRMPNRLIAESAEEQEVLGALGERIRLPVAARTGVEVFDNVPVDAELVQELARRRAVRVYAEALRADSLSVTYRELWRTLELAFQAHGKELVRSIAAFPPVQRLGFDREELEALIALRGKLGHAASRLGPRAVSKADSEAIVSLGRLWSLVDWVVLTKKDASRQLEFDELVPLAAFITPDGSAHIESWVGDEERWVEDHGASSVRFRASGLD